MRREQSRFFFRSTLTKRWKNRDGGVGSTEVVRRLVTTVTTYPPNFLHAIYASIVQSILSSANITHTILQQEP